MPEREVYIPGVPCWVDTNQPDPDAAAAFYRGLFGWELEDVMPPGSPGKYLMARLHGGLVAAVGSVPDGAPPMATWNTYVAVASADDAVARARDAGGTVLMEPFDVMDAGRMAVLADPEGAVFEVWEARESIGAGVVNESGSLNFNGLNTRDAGRAKDFYGEVFGWRWIDVGGGAEMWTMPGYGDHLEEKTPGLRAGMAEMGAPPGFEDVVAAIVPIPADQPDTPAYWSVTFAVDDADAAAAKAQELGATVLAPPFDAPWVRMTVIRDPQGAFFVASQFVAENKDLARDARHAGPMTHVDDDTDFQDPGLSGYPERLARLRDEQGIARLRFGTKSGLVVLRHADVMTIFRDDSRFSKSAATRPATFPFMGPNIQGYDGHEHTVKRALVSPAFRRTVIPRYVDPLLRPVAEELVAEIAPLGESDLMATFAKQYPMRIITQLLGIPRDDEDRMAAWAKAMLAMTADPDGARRANAEFTEYVAPLVDERRARPGDDLLSAIVTEAVDGQRLGDDEVFGFLRLLFPAGVDTTWLTLGILLGAVLQQPGAVRDRVLESEEERGWAIEETLRWESTTGSEPRITLEDVVIADTEVPAGKLLRLAVPVANRDPRVFSDPDRWDLDRRPTNHVAFGLGRHFCLGAFLARAELDVALEALLRGLPGLRLEEDLRVYGVVLRGPRTLRVAWDVP